MPEETKINMENEKRLEIASLAESIAEDYLNKNSVDLYTIAENQSITIIPGNYEDYFLGELVYDSGDFFIHLNYDKLSHKDDPRTRFTLAHEYGHYFIDEHRLQLKNGISLHKSSNEGGIKRCIEREANFFASNLLMPSSHFINLSSSFEPGIASILSLKKEFQTSIESTAIRYNELDILPCLLIKWQEDITHRYIGYSQSFSNLTQITNRPTIQVNTEYVRETFRLLNTLNVDTDYIVEQTKLSKWIPTIRRNSYIDYPCIEQTYKLGNYGGLTLLIITK